MMFKRRDIPPVLLLLLLIILIMLTLSQILVVHNGRYGKNVHNMRRLQLELREMDQNLHAMMLQDVPSIELNRRQLHNEMNARRVASIISEAAQPDELYLQHLSLVSDIRGEVGDRDGLKFRSDAAQNLWSRNVSKIEYRNAVGINSKLESNVDYSRKTIQTPLDTTFRTSHQSIKLFRSGNKTNSYTTNDKTS